MSTEDWNSDELWEDFEKCPYCESKYCKGECRMDYCDRCAKDWDYCECDDY